MLPMGVEDEIKRKPATGIRQLYVGLKCMCSYEVGGDWRGRG